MLGGTRPGSLPQPKRGYEAEFARLLPLLEDSDAETLRERFFEIITPVFETLGAPRVGIDEAADEWLRTKVSPARFEEARNRMRGYYVLDLLPSCDGFPLYSNYHAGQEGRDRYSFRLGGQVKSGQSWTGQIRPVAPGRVRVDRDRSVLQVAS